MKTQHLLFSLLLCGLTATAQDSVGFDFSDEDVAADAQYAKQQELQALIGNAAEPRSPALQANSLPTESHTQCPQWNIIRDYLVQDTFSQMGTLGSRETG